MKLRFAVSLIIFDVVMFCFSTGAVGFTGGLSVKQMVNDYLFSYKSDENGHDHSADHLDPLEVYEIPPEHPGDIPAGFKEDSKYPTLDFMAYNTLEDGSHNPMVRLYGFNPYTPTNDAIQQFMNDLGQGTTLPIRTALIFIPDYFRNLQSLIEISGMNLKRWGEMRKSSSSIRIIFLINNPSADYFLRQFALNGLPVDYGQLFTVCALRYTPLAGGTRVKPESRDSVCYRRLDFKSDYERNIFPKLETFPYEGSLIDLELHYGNS